MHSDRSKVRWPATTTAEHLTGLSPKQIHHVARLLGRLRGDDRLGQVVDCAAIGLGDPIAVHVERQRKGAVPQPFRHLPKVDARRELHRGERKASSVHKIADVRTGPEAPGTDGDVHNTTSVAFTDGHVYAAAGSSCNATMDYGKQPCTEVDPTRAAVSIMKPDGSDFHQRAKRVRNSIALAVNPDTQSLWIGGAGQDSLPSGHPYEYLDDLSAHPGDADYGWPVCEEDHHVYWPGYHCGKTVAPLVELPAYSTIIGATFYPLHQTGRYAFPSKYRGGLFAAAHGSWHKDRNGCDVDSPRVVFVAMKGDAPAKDVDWNDPTKQWSEFVTGFQSGCNSRIGRATGIAVGPKGSLFIADDQAGAIYRVRPAR